MIGRVRWRFAEVDSTQNIAFRLAEFNAPHGTIVRADFQSAGRGRQGKSWVAGPGSSLMFSTILRPDFPVHELGTASILVASALADAIDAYIDAPVHIKWPNDVYIDGLKTSGILLQTRSGPDPLAVLGIGINISVPDDALPPGATCLNRHMGDSMDVEALFQDVLMRLNHMWSSLRPGLGAVELAVLESRLWQLGEMVSIIDADREIHGRILGLAKNGGLRLSVEGRERVVMAGEITRGPRPIFERSAN